MKYCKGGHFDYTTHGIWETGESLMSVVFSTEYKTSERLCYVEGESAQQLCWRYSWHAEQFCRSPSGHLDQKRDDSCGIKGSPGYSGELTPIAK